MSLGQARYLQAYLASACLVLCGFCAIIGFLIVFHYANFQRPLREFAIVVDAGSTQTRSSLFSVELDEAVSLAADATTNKAGVALTGLLKVSQVGSCVDGAPLSSLNSQAAASRLFAKCLNKFTQTIKRLDFDTDNDKNDDDDDGKLTAKNQNEIDNSDDQLESEAQPRGLAAIREEMALAEHRVNSVVRLYLGATAGMRSLRELDAARALQRINWTSEAIDQLGEKMRDVPFVNKEFVGIIEGSEEAAFGWISVNFIGGQLRVAPNNNQVASYDSRIVANSLGTVELGGASAQMAFEVNSTEPEDPRLSIKQVTLFGQPYKLATRSDLCLGMSQAIARLNYLLALRHYQAEQRQAKSEPIPREQLELANPCLQNEARVSFSGLDFARKLGLPCLSSSPGARPPGLTGWLTSHKIIKFVGNGDTIRCSALITDLIEPARCSSQFAICPENKNTRPPPTGMPFVTISGYNKALEVLSLSAADNLASATPNELALAEKLGARSVNHSQLIEATNSFCAYDVSEFPIRFPRMNKNYHSVNCLQLVYIQRLLTDFYLFEPATSWKSLKFALFPTASDTLAKGGSQQGAAESTVAAASAEAPTTYDLGWALGLLVNATSHRLDEPPDSRLVAKSEVIYHHGATILFVIRSTLFLIFACFLLALALIVASAALVQRRQSTGQAYISTD